MTERAARRRGGRARAEGTLHRPPDQDVFRAIATFTYDWESWIDLGGRVAWVNPAVERMTGYTVEECLRMPDYPLPLIHPSDRERIAAALSGARRGSSGNDVELRVIDKRDRSVRWLAMSWQPIVIDGTDMGYRSSVRDINERKKAEEALREADRAKGEFLAVMSHEIRSPMQAISGYAQLLARSDLTPKQRTQVEVIQRENAALLRIVQDVLDFSALQGGALLLERVAFDYRDVVHGVLDATRLQAKQKNISLRARVDVAVPASIVGDPQRVRQILLNLVHNAVKFTNKGGVTVNVRVQGGSLVTRIRDTGPGIPKAQMGRLFEMFSQGDSSTARRHGGSGLGLAIAKRLSKRLGGDIGVTSAPRKGSTFVFRFPLEAGTGIARQIRERIDVDLAARVPLSILVVDDSEVARDVAREFLRVLGYSPDVASGGKQAVMRVRKKPYDIVFLDMQMPGLDGLAAAREIRAAASNPVSIVALTANVFVKPDDALDAVMTKPLKLATLATFLSSQLDPKVLQSLLEPRASDGLPIITSLGPRIRSEGEQLLRELESALESNDADGAAAVTHRLKGLALIVGARGFVAEAELTGNRGGDMRSLRLSFSRLLDSIDLHSSRHVGRGQPAKP